MLFFRSFKIITLCITETKKNGEREQRREIRYALDKIQPSTVPALVRCDDGDAFQGENHRHQRERYGIMMLEPHPSAYRNTAAK
jgi:hypothetical protein